MHETDDLDRQRALIDTLAVSLQAQAGRVEQFETHISRVLVAGAFAYKFKKAVRFDFLDFSSLRARQFYCQEEVRLNRRLAPDTYLDAVAIGGSIEHPSFSAEGPALEYCVRMRAFPQQALWRHRLRQRLVTAGEVEQLGQEIARFHLCAAIAPPEAPWGGSAELRHIAEENIAQIIALAPPGARGQALKLQSWSATQLGMLDPVFAQRKRDGYIRECHGDLHSGNLLTQEGRVQAFDCIEFNDSLRWIDVINDIAFVCMDLGFQGRRDLAARCLNRYLDLTGDYEGVRVLRYYQVQRALVRCKTALLRARQAGMAPAEAADAEREAARYLECAARDMLQASPAIMITHGFSGSGKSVFARQVVECTGAIQLRSDVERKRLQACGALGGDLYAPQAKRLIYERLLMLTRMLVQCGMPVVVDAVFLREESRRMFGSLARALGVPFHIFDVRATEATMRARVIARKQSGQDPSDAGVEVLEQQLRDNDALSGEEMQDATVIDTEAGISSASVRGLWRRIARLPARRSVQ